MLGKAVLCLTFHFYSVSAQNDCTDLRGRLISHGLHYVPGPDTCTLCVCDNGGPKACKAVLCSPPQDCRSFRVGNTCCEFICLDDVVKSADGSESNLRMAGGGAVAVALLTAALVVYRVRRQKRRRPPHNDDQRSLTSIGVTGGRRDGARHIMMTRGASLALGKFICLDDVVKSADGSESKSKTTVALLSAALAVYRARRQKRRRPPHNDDQRSLTSIGYISGSMGYMGGTCETALAAWKPPGNYLPRGEAPPPYDEAVAQCRSDVMRMSNETPFHRTYPTNLEGMVRPDEPMQCSGHGYINIPRPVQQMANPANCYAAPLLQPHPEPPLHHPLAPNLVGFPSAIRLTGSLGAISNRGLSVLREPEPERPHNVPGFYTSPASLHRTIPRISTAIDTTILDTSISGFNRCDRSLHNEIRRSFHKPGERSMADTGRSMPRNLNLASGTSRAHSEEHNVGGIEPKPLKAVGKSTAEPAPQTTLPLTVDKPSCVCSYSESAPGGEEPDDYRSECENCKSATSSRWVLDPGWRDEADEGTQTLQRRAPPPAPPPPATATLPQPVTKQRPTGGPQSNWENWFNTIPDSDTESEEE